MVDDDCVIIIRRRFDAPRELVYRIWTDPSYVAQWWGIDGAVSTVRALDVRPGGRWEIDMRTTEGDTYANAGVYSEVIANERLVYVDDPDLDRTSNDFAPPAGTYTTTFVSDGDATVVTIQARFGSAAERDRVRQSGMIEGIGQGLNRLEIILRTMRKTS